MTWSLRGVKPLPRLLSPPPLFFPSDISYSQGNSVLGIWAFDIVRRQLPLLLFPVAPRKSQITHFCGERRVLSRLALCGGTLHMGAYPRAGKMLERCSRRLAWMPRGWEMLLSDPAALWVCRDTSLFWMPVPKLGTHSSAEGAAHLQSAAGKS